MHHALLTRIGDARVGRRKRVVTAIEGALGAPRTAKAVLVTGASEGIGIEMARTFADTGEALVLIARDATKLSRAANVLENELSCPVHTLAMDLTSSDALDTIDAFIDEHGLQVSVLINNAGAAYAGPVLDQSAEVVEHMLRLNMTVPAQLIHRHLPGMALRGEGGVVNVSSLGGFYPGPYQSHYYASKAYLTNMSEALGYEAGGTGVRVLAVAPGPVDTHIHTKMGGDTAYYRLVLPSLTPQRVARDARRAYALGQRLVVPGIFNRLMATVGGIVPHSVLLPFLALLLRPQNTIRMGEKARNARKALTDTTRSVSP
ncbi:MAG: SDR family NAD(P)-dependent oxidoreductase [Pseudomonadota bacterium]